MKDEDLKKIAKNRVEFRDHVLVYLVVNAILFTVNILFSPGFYWFIIVLLFWGIGLLFHYREAYYGTEEMRIEREYQILKKQSGSKTTAKKK